MAGLIVFCLFLLIVGGIAAGIIFFIITFKKSESPQEGWQNVRQQMQRITQSLLFRSAMIGLIGVLMWIPLTMVDGVVDERHALYRDVLRDIAGSWGHEQHLRGPVLAIPYTEKYLNQTRIKDENGKIRTETTEVFKTFTAYVLPEKLNIAGNIAEEHRRRGIYDSLVYTTDVTLNGHYMLPDFAELSSDLHQIHWNRAWVSVGLSDTRAIRQTKPLAWNNQALSWSPGSKIDDIVGTGFHAEVPLQPNATQPQFSITLAVNGSGGFYFAPLGERTISKIDSAWPHPSFRGHILPAERHIDEQGFKATWDIPHLARDYPQVWTDANQKIHENIAFQTTGVSLFEPIFLYQLLDRAIKYGLLFIGLTFLTFLMFELATRSRIHIVQYGLVGMALVVFFLVLLSLAEHIVFPLAYWLAASLAIAMISGYVRFALASTIRGLQIAGILGLLYGLLYTILHLEDYALLMGTVLIVIVLGVLMFLTRKLQLNTTGAGANATST